MLQLLLSALFLLPFIIHAIDVEIEHHEYIILGAGAGGLQMAYLMQHFDDDVNVDYLVLERNAVAGNFFNKYPRQNMLLSINKVFTGNEHHEFNLRHDWNSLLTSKKSKHNKYAYNINSEHYRMRFANYSEEYYPHRRDLARYLSDFADYFKLNIKYNAEVTHVEQDELNDDKFILDVTLYSEPQNSHEDNKSEECEVTYLKFSCKHLFVATGLSKPNVPPIPGIEHATAYADMSLDIDTYKNKRIAVLGGKNSAFEVAQFVSQVSAHTHLLPILMPRFSYETHYVGDVRAVNMRFLDHYLLKSLDAMTEQTILQIELTYNATADTIQLQPKDFGADDFEEMYRPWPLRGDYDFVLYATGWKFQCAIFSENLCAKMLPNPKKLRYPSVTNQYAAKRVRNMHFLGTAMHSVDWKKSAGAFIHGFRYVVKAVYHQVVERSFKHTMVRVDVSEIAKHFMFRMNTASSYYQMFAVMTDALVVRRNVETGDMHGEYFYDLLVAQINALPVTDDECVAIITMTFDYSDAFIGHDTVLYDRNRVVQDYRKAHEAKFLHPVLREYSCKILENRNDNSYQDYAASKFKMRERHIIEDFLTLFDDPKYHFEWLATWIKKVVGHEQTEWKYDTQDLVDAYE